MILLLRYLLRLLRPRGAGDPSRRDVPSTEALDRETPSAEDLRRPARPSAASRGAAAVLAHQVRYDLIASFRNPRARFLTFVFPLILLVLLAGLFGGGTTTIDGVRVQLSHFYVPGILAMSVMNATYSSLVISLSNLRESGVLKRRRSTPIPPALLIASQAVTTLVSVAIMSFILLLVGRLAYGIGFSLPALAALACTIVVATLACCCIGYAVAGLVGSPDAAQPIVQLTTLPLYFISGVFVPTADLGSTIRTIAKVFPVERLADSLQLAALHSSFGAALSPTDLLVLAVWGVGAAAFAARRFSWLPSTATA